MSDLTFIEKTKLEKQFQMGGGYVLDFSNRTLAEFVADSMAEISTTGSTTTPAGQRPIAFAPSGPRSRITSWAS
jgi:hypothetical protein